MVSDSSSSGLSWRDRPVLPAPDSREGAAIAVSIAGGLVYVVLFVAAYPGMARLAFSATTVSLLASLIPAFALAAMLGSDISTFQRLELELARTVLAYVGSGTPPASDTPLAGVWRAHIAASEEARRMARAHAYALGLFTLAGIVSLAAVLLSGMGTVTQSMNVRGLAMFVEWFAFMFLLAGATSVAVTVGYASSETFYERFVPRRWRRNSGRQQAVDGAVGEIAWLAEYARGAAGSRISPAGPSMLPSWRE